MRVTTDAEKPSPKIQPLMSLPFHTGPWVTAASQGKNVGLASIGLGLGVRAAMPRMPSFKVRNLQAIHGLPAECNTMQEKSGQPAQSNKINQLD